MELGEPYIMYSRPHAHIPFRCDEHFVAPLFADCFAQDLFRKPHRIGVGGIKEVHARLKADIDEFFCFIKLSCADMLKNIDTPKGHCAKTQLRDLQSRFPNKSIFHFPLWLSYFAS